MNLADTMRIEKSKNYIFSAMAAVSLFLLIKEDRSIGSLTSSNGSTTLKNTTRTSKTNHNNERTAEAKDQDEKEFSSSSSLRGNKATGSNTKDRVERSRKERTSHRDSSVAEEGSGDSSPQQKSEPKIRNKISRSSSGFSESDQEPNQVDTNESDQEPNQVDTNEENDKSPSQERKSKAHNKISQSSHGFSKGSQESRSNNNENDSENENDNENKNENDGSSQDGESRTDQKISLSSSGTSKSNREPSLRNQVSNGSPPLETSFDSEEGGMPVTDKKVSRERDFLDGTERGDAVDVESDEGATDTQKDEFGGFNNVKKSSGRDNFSNVQVATEEGDTELQLQNNQLAPNYGGTSPEEVDMDTTNEESVAESGLPTASDQTVPSNMQGANSWSNEEQGTFREVGTASQYGEQEAVSLPFGEQEAVSQPIGQQGNFRNVDPQPNFNMASDKNAVQYDAPMQGYRRKLLEIVDESSMVFATNVDSFHQEAETTTILPVSGDKFNEQHIIINSPEDVDAASADVAESFAAVVKT